MGYKGPLPGLRLVGATPEAQTEAAVAGSMAKSVRGATTIEKPEAVANSKVLNEVWDWLVPQLIEAGLASNMDAMTVELAVRHYAHAVEASDQLLADDLLVEGRNEYKKNPLETIFRAESMAFLGYSKMLGLSFGARVRMKDPTTDSDGDDTKNPFNSATGS